MALNPNDTISITFAVDELQVLLPILIQVAEEVAADPNFDGQNRAAELAARISILLDSSP